MGELSAGVVRAGGPFVIVLDHDGRILRWNHACSEVTGYSFEEVRGKGIWDVLAAPEDVETARRIYGQVLVGEHPAQGAGYLLTKSGARRPIVWSFDACCGDDAAELVTAVGIECTAARQVEEALRRSEAKLARTASRARDQEFLSDAGALLATTLDCSEMLSIIAGLAVRFLADCCIIDLVDETGALRRAKVSHADPAKQALAHRLESVALERWHPHLGADALSSRETTLISEVTAEYLESIARDPEQLAALRELLPVACASLPLLAHGRLIGVLDLIRCSPSASYGPDELRLGEQLASRAAYSLDRARTHRAAQDAIRARDRVLGAVAHDLRNPINTASIALSTLMMVRELEEDHRASRTAEIVLRSLDLAGRLIQDLLDISVIEAGRLVLDVAPVIPEQLVQHVAEDFAEVASRSSLELGTEVELLLPCVMADEARLARVFSNLVGNALKFTPPGGRIVVGATRGDGEVCFWVRNPGVGIPPDQLPRVFEPFWQASSTDRRGVGIGLSIARAIVHAHEGRIWVESAPGLVTTFFFTIPVGDAPEVSRPGRDLQ